MQNIIDKLINTHLPPLHKNRLNPAFIQSIPSVKKININNSINSFMSLFSDFRNKQNLFSTSRENNYSTMRSSKTQGSRLGNKFNVNSINLKKYLNKYTIALALFLIVGATLVFAINSYRQRPATTSSNNAQPKVQGIIAESSVNREFLFPLLDSEGEVLSNIKFEIVDASLRDEVLVKGQKAYPTENKVFLLLGVKITNDLDQPISMSTKDYARLVVNGNENELLAPEMHNDPVEIQAISTKKTRLGFSVDRDDSDFVLKVGEINGDKQDVPLTLNK